MALLKTLALAGVFTAAAAAGIYTYTPPKPEPLDPEVAAAETALILWRQRLRPGYMRSRDADGFCLDVVKMSDDTPLEACFKTNTGQVKLDRLTRR